MDDLKSKAFSGFSWSLLENLVTNGSQFIIGIILARLISPSEFGLVGIISIFLAVLPIIIDGGLGSALIQRKHCSECDFSSTFYYNLFVSASLYCLLYVCAPTIANFFKRPELTLITRCLGLSLVIAAVGSIHIIIATKRLDFKTLSKVAVFSNIISGIVAIGLAYRGFGVWALVFKILLQNTISSLLLFVFNKWYPTARFDFSVIKSMFTFGSRVLLTGLINTTFENAVFFIIGRYYSVASLGFYTRADMFSKLPSQNLTGVVNRVSFPVLARIQDDPEKLQMSFRKIILTVMFISFSCMFSLAAVSEAMIYTLLGKKWAGSVLYLQLLCFAVVLYPLHAMNLNLLNVKGRADLFLRSELVKKVFLVPIVLVGIYNIMYMLLGLILFSICAFFINTYWTSNYIKYSWRDQIIDLWPTVILSTFVSGIVYGTGIFLPFPWIFVFFIQSFEAIVLVIFFAEVFRIEGYQLLKEILISKCASIINFKNANEYG